jgi:hypothetical protein
MATHTRITTPILAGVAVALLSGCSAASLFGGVSGEYTLSEDDWEDEPPPIAYVDGTATLRLTGGTQAQLELPVQTGSSRSSYEDTTSDTIGFRADPWSVVVNSFSWPGEPDMWMVTVNRLDHGHWTAMSQDACDADIRSTSTTAEGTLACRGLQWLDALAINMYEADSRIPGERPFDVEVAFTATLAEPAPSARPTSTAAPGTSLDPAERTITASHILYSPLDDPAAAMGLPITAPAWATAGQEAQAAADDLKAILDPDEVIAAFEARARESDDTSNARSGGHLGSFTRDTMVPEFADPLFDAVGLQRGDIIGPVRTDFGWHVILYLGEGEPPSF